MKTFGGIPKQYHDLEKARVVLIPVPYDGTSTWHKGADKGPAAFLKAAENMELYDIQTDSEVYKKGIHLCDPLKGLKSPKKMVEIVEKETGKYLDKKKFVTLFGGEHSISIGAIRAFRERHQNLSVVQIDAHADLRPEYEGTPFNHACAVYEASKTYNLVQVGIRSMDVSEKEHMNMEKVFFGHEVAEGPEWMNDALNMIGSPVYITIDLDAFDPGIMPATGTPEPGGMLWWQVDHFLRMICESKKVVGFDIVELCPAPSQHGSEFLAAKLYYKLLSYVFQS